MCNTIRMELYKLFRMRSFWVTMLISVIVIIATAASLVTDIEEDNQMQTTLIGAGAEGNSESDNTSIQFGITEDVEGMDTSDLQVTQIYGTHLASGLFTLVNGIFLVLFVTADRKNGYIKNIGGQVKYRSSLIWAKWVAAAVYTLVFDVAMFVVEAAGMGISLGYLHWGDVKAYLPVIGVQMLLQYVFLIVCMTITMAVRSRALGMVATVCLSMGLAPLVCMGLDSLFLRFFKGEEIHLEQYLLTTKMGELAPGAGAVQIRNILLLVAGYFVVATVLELVLTRKRDLV